MKTAILYGTTHGKTRKVVSLAVRHLPGPVEVINVKDLAGGGFVGDYELLVFFCPTYGDEELQDDMENFFCHLTGDLAGRYFAICELGSYYGYEDFSFGAMRIIRAELLRRNASELCDPLSLDSFPRLHEGHLLDWLDYLKGKTNEHDRPCNSCSTEV